jgi:hypothetical protein
VFSAAQPNYKPEGSDLAILKDATGSLSSMIWSAPTLRPVLSR